MKSLILLLLPTILLAQATPVNYTINFGMYIQTQGNDEVFTGEYSITVNSKIFTLKDSNNVILVKKITQKEGNVLSFKGGDISLLFDDYGLFYGIWHHAIACNKTYYYRKDWHENKNTQ